MEIKKAAHQRPMRLAVLQRVCPSYRVALFAELTKHSDIEMLLLIGDDIPNSKVQKNDRLEEISYKKLKSRFLRVGARILPWHVGLIRELIDFRPDVILCEGESHFIGYLQAIIYKYLFDQKVGLMHWCFISLPGWSNIGGLGFRSAIKRFMRRFFDAFVVYSSFSKECLRRLGQAESKIFVATNVGDVQHYLRVGDSMKENKAQTRKMLDLPDRFTVLYVGTLDESKRPDVLLKLAELDEHEEYNFLLAGQGPLFKKLQKLSNKNSRSNVSLLGKVTDLLPLYYRASDLLLIPGRGGIVISEAMALGLPVIVHQADGTEYDLVLNGKTGYRLIDGSVSDFYLCIEELRKKPRECEKMAQMSRNLISTRYHTENMVNQIIKAADYAKKR